MGVWMFVSLWLSVIVVAALLISAADIEGN
jgi:hypothetical protein